MLLRRFFSTKLRTPNFPNSLYGTRPSPFWKDPKSTNGSKSHILKNLRSILGTVRKRGHDLSVDSRFLPERLMLDQFLKRLLDTLEDGKEVTELDLLPLRSPASSNFFVVPEHDSFSSFQLEESPSALQFEHASQPLTLSESFLFYKRAAFQSSSLLSGTARKSIGWMMFLEAIVNVSTPFIHSPIMPTKEQGQGAATPVNIQPASVMQLDAVIQKRDFHLVLEFMFYPPFDSTEVHDIPNYEDRCTCAGLWVPPYQELHTAWKNHAWRCSAILKNKNYVLTDGLKFMMIEVDKSTPEKIIYRRSRIFNIVVDDISLIIEILRYWIRGYAPPPSTQTLKLN